VVASDAMVNSAHAVAPALLALTLCTEALAYGELSAGSARGASSLYFSTSLSFLCADTQM
jgi:hypothetical protein